MINESIDRPTTPSDLPLLYCKQVFERPIRELWAYHYAFRPQHIVALTTEVGYTEDGWYGDSEVVKIYQ